MLAEYLSTYKCHPCICFSKTPVRSCISSAAIHVTSFTLQPSYSNSCHQSRYYHSCRHKSSSPCDNFYYYGSGQLYDYFCYYNTSQLYHYFHRYNRDQHTTAFTAIIRLVIFSASYTPSRSHTASHAPSRSHTASHFYSRLSL